MKYFLLLIFLGGILSYVSADASEWFPRISTRAPLISDRDVPDPSSNNSSSMEESQALTRDKVRINHLQRVSLAISSYYADYSRYPSPESGCLPKSKLESYLELPVDPLGRTTRRCTGRNGMTYEYGVYKYQEQEWFYVLAKLESSALSNIDKLPIRINHAVISNIKTDQGKSGYYIIVR